MQRAVRGCCSVSHLLPHSGCTEIHQQRRKHRIAHAILQRRPENHELHYLEYEGGSGRVVVRVTEELSSCWEKLADCLRFHSGVVGGVQEDEHHSCEAACCSILILWLQGDPDTRKPVTWATLIQAICA